MGGLISQTDAIVLLDREYQTAKLCASLARKRAKRAKCASDRNNALALSREFDHAATLLDKCISKIMALQPIAVEVFRNVKRHRTA